MLKCDPASGCCPGLVLLGMALPLILALAVPSVLCSGPASGCCLGPDPAPVSWSGPASRSYLLNAL